MRKKIFTSLIVMAFAMIISCAPIYAGEYVITEDITEDLYALNQNGMPYWYPEDVDSFTNFHSDNKDYVRDLADIYTSDEEELIEEKVKELRDKFGVDFVVYTDISNYGLEKKVYAADYFVFNGFGTGDNYSGMILYICMDPNDRGWFEAGTGDTEIYFKSDSNIDKLNDSIHDYLVDGEYAEGTLKFFDKLDNVITKTDRKIEEANGPLTFGKIVKPFLIGLIPGFIIAGLVVLGLVSQMKSVGLATSASRYIVPNSFKLTKEKDRFINVTVARTYNPPKSDDSSSSSFSSSSGSSFSGGGGSF